jgi:hypothetical protein
MPTSLASAASAEEEAVEKKLMAEGIASAY